MDNKYILTSDGELYHWKYVKREKVKGKWKYYYDTDSAKNDAKSAVSNLWNKVRSVTSKKTNKVKSSISKSASTLKNKLSSGVKAIGKKVSKKVSEIASKAKKITHKYIAKVPVGDTFRYFYSDKAYKSYLNGKNAADKALDKLSDKSMGKLVDDAVKESSNGFVSKMMKTGFGKAMYDLVLPAFTALQVAVQTPNSFDKIKKIKEKTTSDEDMAIINPGYNPEKLDYSYNCSFCTAAFDLRKRGYDVEAMPISTLESPVAEDILSWYDGAKAVRESTVNSKLSDKERRSPASRAKALDKALLREGEGARGHLGMYWSMGGGHDIVWSVENGKVVYRDCQTNEKHNMSQLLSFVDDYTYIRVDNCEPNEEVLRTVRNRR